MASVISGDIASAKPANRSERPKTAEESLSRQSLVIETWRPLAKIRKRRQETRLDSLPPSHFRIVSFFFRFSRLFASFFVGSPIRLSENPFSEGATRPGSLTSQPSRLAMKRTKETSLNRAGSAPWPSRRTERTGVGRSPYGNGWLKARAFVRLEIAAT